MSPCYIRCRNKHICSLNTSFSSASPSALLACKYSSDVPGVEHCAGQWRHRSRWKDVCSQEAHCTKPESPTARGARTVCGLTWEGVVYFVQGRAPCDTGGLPRGGGKHTTCILFPLWWTLLLTQQGPHTVPRMAVLQPDGT